MLRRLLLTRQPLIPTHRAYDPFLCTQADGSKLRCILYMPCLASQPAAIMLCPKPRIHCLHLSPHNRAWVPLRAGSICGFRHRQFGTKQSIYFIAEINSRQEARLSLECVVLGNLSVLSFKLLDYYSCKVNLYPNNAEFVSCFPYNLYKNKSQALFLQLVHFSQKGL